MCSGYVFYICYLDADVHEVSVGCPRHGMNGAQGFVLSRVEGLLHGKKNYNPRARKLANGRRAKKTCFCWQFSRSFPIKLPLSWLGFGGRPTQPIPNSSKDAPWSADLDHAVLGPFFSKDGSGGYGETAFFHKVNDLCASSMGWRAFSAHQIAGIWPWCFG